VKKFASVFRTTAVRLSALYLVLFAVCAVVLVFYVTAMSENLLRTQTQQAVISELQALSRGYQAGGITTLVRMVERRSRQPGANLYIIAAPTGEILAGNVASLQPGTLDAEGWTALPFRYDRYTDTQSDVRHSAIAQVVSLPNGMRLLVGRDLGEPERFRSLIRQALMVALGIMGAGALLIWLFIGRRALHRIDSMSLASQKIMAGDLSQRLPVGTSGDEFDRLSTSLNAMLGRIATLNEGLRQVSDNIAHDLKTPLTRLRNKAEAALVSPTDADGYRAALEQMIEESDQLIRTFNALLMISRVEAGSSAAELNPVNLSDIARDAAELYEPVAEEQQVRITTDIAPDIMVSGNRELIGQTLSNLIDNALKYAGDRPGAAIAITLEQEGQDVHLAVVDNGPGIAAADREAAIQRFVRLDGSRTKPGTGLGLSLVAAVMALHGGRFDLSDAALDEDDATGLRASMIFRQIMQDEGRHA
jgi:signal transduction histidine kinase